MKKSLVLAITLLLVVGILASGASAGCVWERRTVDWWYSCGACNPQGPAPDGVYEAFVYVQTSDNGCEYYKGYTTGLYEEYYCAWVYACGK